MTEESAWDRARDRWDLDPEARREVGRYWIARMKAELGGDPLPEPPDGLSGRLDLGDDFE